MNKKCRDCFYFRDDIEKCRDRKCWRAFHVIDAWTPRRDKKEMKKHYIHIVIARLKIAILVMRL